MPRPTLSIVFPVHDELINLGPLRIAMRPLLTQLAPSFDVELVFVDDGSTDGSAQWLRTSTWEGATVTVVELARNYGHQAALTAGLRHARGDAVVTMDADLQDPPEVVLELVARWRDGAAVVHAQRRSRQDAVLKQMTADLAYRVVSAATGGELPRDTADFKLLDRRVVDQVCASPEVDRYLRGLVAVAGHRQDVVPYDRDKRWSGESKYDLRQMIRLGTAGLFGFSRAPVGLLWTVGLAAVVVAMVLTATTLAGATSWLAVLIGWSAAAQLCACALLGSYAVRVLEQVRGRPLYTVARTTETVLR